MNENIILEKVKPFLSTRNSIRKSTFRDLFNNFSQLDLVEIVNILEEHRIIIDVTDSING